MLKIMSAEEVRNKQHIENIKINEKELLEIQDKITKSIEEGNYNNWITIDKISDRSIEILKNLGYECDKYYGNANEEKSYYCITW